MLGDTPEGRVGRVLDPVLPACRVRRVVAPPERARLVVSGDAEAALVHSGLHTHVRQQRVDGARVEVADADCARPTRQYEGLQRLVGRHRVGQFSARPVQQKQVDIFEAKRAKIV